MGNNQSRTLQYQPINGLEISEFITAPDNKLCLTVAQSIFLYRRFYWLQQNHERKAFRVINLPSIRNLKKIGDYEGPIYAFQARGWFSFVLVRCNNVFCKKSIENLTYICDDSSIEFNPVITGGITEPEKSLLRPRMIMSIVEDHEMSINWVYEVTAV